MKEQIGVMLSSSEVENRISEMAAAIDKAYEGKTIHLIGILKGSVFFMCELAKRMKSPVTMDFMSVSSYGDGTKSSGIVKLNKDLRGSLFSTSIPQIGPPWRLLAYKKREPSLP